MVVELGRRWVVLNLLISCLALSILVACLSCQVASRAAVRVLGGCIAPVRNAVVLAYRCWATGAERHLGCIPKVGALLPRHRCLWAAGPRLFYFQTGTHPGHFPLSHDPHVPSLWLVRCVDDVHNGEQTGSEFGLWALIVNNRPGGVGYSGRGAGADEGPSDVPVPSTSQLYASWNQHA
jgi:hypothetical protein